MSVVPADSASTAIDLAAYIRPGDTVLWGQAQAEPLTLTRALVAQRHAFKRLRLLLGIDAGRTLLPEHADAFDFVSYCGAGGNRALAQAGVLDVLPIAYSQWPDLLRTQAWHVDVVLVQVSPADERGFHSLGLANDLLIPALQRARVVLAEVNPDVPWTHGSRCLQACELGLAVPAQVAPLELPRLAPTPLELRIAHRVAGLVDDGAILQLGVGGVANVVLGLLHDRRDLGLHSGIVGDGLVDLAESGALTNSRKPVDRGLSVAALLMGSQRLYRFAHRNPSFALRSCEHTHSAAVLQRFDRFTAINSAIEVDLTGQINAEVALGQYVGAVGGAPDFTRAALHSPGGVPIVALSSMAQGRSRIVSRLSGPVTTPRCDAGVFVTEHGVADLRGQPLKVRVRRMLDIADPGQRAGLAEQALAQGLL